MSKPIWLCDTAGMDEELWLECRKHGPKGDLDYTLGGSDVSTVFGESPWNTPLELWREKRDIAKRNDSVNKDQKEMGHLMEPIVAHWYGVKSGNKVIEDTGLYQHGDHPWALANLDYRVQEATSGEEGVLEIKTTTWHKADDWADDKIPRYYELQVRFYLAVMDLEFADICCLWGMNPNTDMAIRRINRDRALESLIFQRLEQFIVSLRTGVPPTMGDVKPQVAMAALARIYEKSQSGLPTIEFNKKQEKRLRRIAVLQAENSALTQQVKNNEKEVVALSVRIAEMMKEHEHGLLETTHDRILVDFITKTSRRVDSERLKKEYGSVYEAVLKESNSRKLQVKVVAS